MEVALFSEDQGRAVVSCARVAVEAVIQLAGKHGVAATVIGTTGGTHLEVNDALRLSVDQLRQAWDPEG
jgi:phosphoribosylformylglycinamidine (FGAM) synthase-like enzyme